MRDIDPDLDLMGRIAAGDAGAVRQLVSTSTPRIWLLACRVLHDQAAAEDIVQETLIRAVRTAPKWKAGSARLDTWLHTVALNLCRDTLRRRKEVAMPELPERADPASGAEASLIDAERSAQVAVAIQGLPDRQREAIILVHYQGLSSNEAATILEVSIEALESLLSRGRRHLKQQFSKQEHDDA
ncbi:RNA polymerase sigma factor [Neorhizobium sp. NCHU2750]|uniref:RNA polymerase sigma factor n=1 Tax=Neorhizobium sp. NCHU2750 TaxID=1825976 RepID=UPI001FE2124F